MTPVLRGNGSVEENGALFAGGRRPRARNDNVTRLARFGQNLKPCAWADESRTLCSNPKCGDKRSQTDGRHRMARLRVIIEAAEAECALRFYMRAHPEDATGIETVLRFRKHIREELDRLIGDSRPSELQANRRSPRTV